MAYTNEDKHFYICPQCKSRVWVTKHDVRDNIALAQCSKCNCFHEWTKEELQVDPTIGTGPAFTCDVIHKGI